MLLALLLLVAGSEAQNLNGLNHLRFGCSQITIERLDPLVNPGQVPTPHMHQVVGGNSFNASMATSDISKIATCTTCGPPEDLSNYWTANLFFKARNGSYKRVPQVPNRWVFDDSLTTTFESIVGPSEDGIVERNPTSHGFLFNDRFTTQTSGGITVYYIAPKKSTVTAFKPGFRMLVGDPANRQKKYKSQSCFRCYSGPNFGGDNAAPCSDTKLDFEGFPPQPCLGGIRSNILYPTCWDGKNLDSPNHKDHVAYPTAGPSNFLSTGNCPASHPVKIPQLMLEIVWDTTQFNNKADWPADGSQPFYLSTGDNTGYGQHGDYVFGWKDDALQKAMDANGCFSATCGGLKTQDISVANKCQIKKTVKEETEGWLSELPGVPMKL